MRILTFAGGPVMTNTFVVADDDGQAVVIDPGHDPVPVDDEIRRAGLKVVAIVGTHGHFDHVCCAAEAIELWQAPYYLHADTVPVATTCGQHALWFGLRCADSPAPDRLLAHGDRLEVGTLSFEVRDVSGHCPGSIALLTPGHAFVGDVLFNGSIGRVDLPHSDGELLMRNIRDQLMVLPDETVVYPGHGENTSIGDERRWNPFKGAWH